MKMNLKYIFTLACAILFSSGASAAIPGEWKMHPNFDNSVTRVIDTPERVYFMGYSQVLYPGVSYKENPDCSLFYYDKEGDEMVAVAQRFATAGMAVRLAEYNTAGKYLLVVYADYNIDFIFDSGDIRNVPVLKNANIPGSKNVNGISFSPENNLAYLATDFGYLAINDQKFEIAESRNYGTVINSAIRLGADILLASDSHIYRAPASSPRLNINEYTTLEGYPGAKALYSISDKKILRYTIPGKNTHQADLLEFSGDNVTATSTFKAYNTFSVNPTKDGVVVMISTTSIYFKADSKYPSYQKRPEADTDITGATADQINFWAYIPRQGLRCHKLNSDKTFSLVKDFMLPNAPNPYYSRGMAFHNRHGLLVNSFGQDGVFEDNSVSEPLLLCGYLNGEWTSLSPSYRYPEQAKVGQNPVGLAIDPSDDKFVYMGSPFSGMTRLNLDDPKDIIHYSFSGDPTASLPGYVETNPIIQAWKRTCPFLSPAFDANRTLWAYFASNDNEDRLEFRYLTEADRKATTNASNARPWKKLFVNGLSQSFSHLFLPLSTSVNKNLLIFISEKGILVYDHNGTPDNTSDDKKQIINSLTDQDGGRVSLYQPSAIWEDPASGIVWLGTSSGLFYCQPKNLLQGQAIINRVKVARNDGTSLADYLLNGIPVTSICSDGSGRKWFGAINAGIIVTSEDARTVLAEFTSANSDLPSDNVYKLCYNPTSKSMMVSTSNGLAEFFIGGSANSSSDEQKVRVYPNPVAPDYYGWVTIDGLPDNSLVKVVDAQGNLVRELGRAEAGTTQWDVNNLYNKRVKTGVYYILSSGTSSDNKESNVAKILIMN